MKKLLTFSFILFISLNIEGAALCADTLQPVKPYKISRRQFLNKYGVDDTARAIINYYFKERKNALVLAIIGAPLATFGGKKLSEFGTNHSTKNESLGIFLVLFAELTFFYGAQFLFQQAFYFSCIIQENAYGKR